MLKCNEFFKNIPWYNNYQASDMWNIKSLNYRNSWKSQNLKFWTDKWWYKYIVLTCNWKRETLKIHRLVALTFLSVHNLQVNHKNWIKNDNRLCNLEYVTASDNIKHRFQKLWHKSPNFWKFWKNNACSKKINQFSLDWDFIKTWDSIMDIERKHIVNHTNISAVCKWKQKTAGWFKWEYFKK